MPPVSLGDLPVTHPSEQHNSKPQVQNMLRARVLWRMHPPMHAHNYTKLCARSRTAGAPELGVRVRDRRESGLRLVPAPSVWSSRAAKDGKADA